MNTHLFQELINQGFLPYILVIITYILISATTQLLLKKNKKQVFKYGLFPFQKSISSNSYKPLDYSKFEGRIRSKNIVLESFHNNEEVFLKVTEVKSRKSKVYLHGNLTQDKRSGNYQLKMKFFLHRLLSPVFALVVMYLFVFKMVPFINGDESASLDLQAFQIMSVVFILIAIAGIVQVIYLGRRDFKFASELIESLINETNRETKSLITEQNEVKAFDKVLSKGKFQFEANIVVKGEFSVSKFKETLSLSRLNSLLFKEDELGRILFIHKGPIDWQGKERFNPNKPIYSNVAAITHGYLEKVSDSEVIVKMKFVKWFFYFYFIPVIIPLMLMLGYQDTVYIWLYLPLMIPTTILTIFFYVRTKRYFKLLCQTFENK